MRRRPRPRPRLAGLAALLVVGALGASAALAARPVTRGRALAVANAIVLRHGDLPGYTQTPNPVTPFERRLTAQATACAGGVPSSKAYANVQSPVFQTLSPGLVAISSGAEILPTPALAQKDFDAVKRPQALGCLLAEIEQSLRPTLPSGSRFSRAKAARLPSVVPGMRQSFTLRFTISVTSGGSTVVVYEDAFGFVDGQAEVNVNVDTTGSAPSTSIERRLAAVLVARARATLR